MDGGRISTLVIDTNIVFSALLKKNSPLGSFLFQAGKKYEVNLIAPEFIREELSHHFTKAVQLTGLTETECEIRLRAILDQIEIIDEQAIPIKYFAQAATLLREIDLNDVAFLATTIHYRALLLTGDFALYRGLLGRGYTEVILFSELKAELNIA